MDNPPYPLVNLENSAKTWRLSPDEFPAITEHWDFNVKALQLRKIQEFFELATKKATTFCAKCICLCLWTLLAIYRVRTEKQFFGIFTGRIRQHRILVVLVEWSILHNENSMLDYLPHVEACRSLLTYHAWNSLIVAKKLGLFKSMETFLFIR